MTGFFFFWSVNATRSSSLKSRSEVARFGTEVEVGQIHPFDSDTYGALAATPTGFRFYVAANTGTKNQYLNNLAVVPEPSTLFLLELAGFAAGTLRRRQV